MLFKFAAEPWEFEAIHRLNYRTFVEEIPQHPANPEARLVDRFHAENAYAVCLDGGRVVGMICGRAARPFSLDEKLRDLDSYLPSGRRAFEIRLLAVEPDYRKRSVFAGLARLLARRFREDGFDLAVISGTTRQMKLYAHLGFVPFGPLVGRDGAHYQPMYLTLESFLGRSPALAEAAAARYLCGPVEVHEDVRGAFAEPPISHRGEEFRVEFDLVRQRLCALAGAPHVELLLGSGTLANDAVAAQLSLSAARGLVLSNGEFGERLVDHASRHGLSCDVIRAPWGERLDYARIRAHLAADPRLRWLWAVHCETSTGVLNDLEELKAISAANGARLCVDCVSSIGALPVNLAGVHLASCVSGKALGSFSGLSMVFHAAPIEPSRALPRYLDLGYYAAQRGVPFSASSNLVRALRVALERQSLERCERLAETSAWLRRRLRQAGLRIVAPEPDAAPAVITLALPAHLASPGLGRRLKQAGFELGYESAYLLERNWIQIGLMGEFSRASLKMLLDTLADFCGQSPEQDRAAPAPAPAFRMRAAQR